MAGRWTVSRAGLSGSPLASLAASGLVRMFGGLGVGALCLLATPRWAQASEPLSFYTITPCRWFDTRQTDRCAGETMPWDLACPTGPLRDGETRYFNAQSTGACRTAEGWDLVPLGAKALAVNVTAVGATGSGHLVVYNGTLADRPPTSSVNFPGQRARAAFMIVELGQLQFQDPHTPWWPDTAIYAHVSDGGIVHVVADVVGYFAP
jgi:hypothetical protein